MLANNESESNSSVFEFENRNGEIPTRFVLSLSSVM
jgi:hypothetical protein